MVVVVVAAAGRFYSLHCTATEEKWKVQVHTIPYYNDNNETGPELDSPSSDGGRGELEGGYHEGHTWKRTQKGERKNLVSRKQRSIRERDT